MTTSSEVTLCIETDCYAGNIEREVTAYLFGFADDYQGKWVDTIGEQWEEDVPEETRKLLDDLLEARPVDEYGLMIHTCDADIVRIFLNNHIMADHQWRRDVLKYIVDRLGDSIEYTGIMGKPAKVGIKKIYFEVGTTVYKNYTVGELTQW